jgi:hypothetical protein
VIGCVFAVCALVLTAASVVHSRFDGEPAATYAPFPRPAPVLADD